LSLPAFEYTTLPITGSELSIITILLKTILLLTKHYFKTAQKPITSVVFSNASFYFIGSQPTFQDYILKSNHLVSISGSFPVIAIVFS
jgi:hypothetical protein